jgi:hypothetical protein
MLAKILNNQIVQYPYTLTNFIADNNNTNYAADTNILSIFSLTAVAALGYTCVDVATTVPPTYDPDTQTLTEGTPELLNSVWTQTWVLTDQTLSLAQQNRLVNLTSQCANTIVGGFTSNALGTTYTYPSKPTDQANLIGSITASLLPNISAQWTTPFWCGDSSNNWSYVSHTAPQIQQVGVDGKDWILVNQSKLLNLSVQIISANSVPTVRSIVW